MTLYRVMWEIDVDAEDERKAAEEARRYQVAEDSIATVFSVVDREGSGQLRRIDVANEVSPGDGAAGPVHQDGVDWSKAHVHPYSVGSFGAAIYERGRNGYSRQVAVTRWFGDAEAIVEGMKKGVDSQGRVEVEKGLWDEITSFLELFDADWGWDSATGEPVRLRKEDGLDGCQNQGCDGAPTSCRSHGHPCSECGGEGCAECDGTGWD